MTCLAFSEKNRKLVDTLIKFNLTYVIWVYLKLKHGKPWAGQEVQFCMIGFVDDKVKGLFV